MPHHKIQSTAVQMIPGCSSPFFENFSSQQFIQIQSCKSFSKSKDKKLKLINNRRSLQKSIEFLQHKRKIKPLNLKVAHIKQEQRTKKILCSIKGFKQKINKITHDSHTPSNFKMASLNTEMSQTNSNSITKSIDRTTKSSEFHILLNNQEIASNHVFDPFPTLGNSLLVQEPSFNPESLLQSKKGTHPSKQISYENSPKFEDIQINFLTPQKMKIDSQEPSTRVSSKKEKINLHSARRVQTFQTLVTQNEICYSVAEQNEYKKFFETIAFPDHFSNKQNRQKSQDKQPKTHKNIQSSNQHIKIY